MLFYIAMKKKFNPIWPGKCTIWKIPVLSKLSIAFFLEFLGPKHDYENLATFQIPLNCILIKELVWIDIRLEHYLL